MPKKLTKTSFNKHSLTIRLEPKNHYLPKELFRSKILLWKRATTQI